jgi:hypothetical protein|tara:strand:- start:1122 stop:1415 length:294 start_codon:yes stop_codon:yes gene_type:complete
MGMSMHISGFKPVDKKFREMLAAYRACESAGIQIPSEVESFFEGEPPDDTGISISLSSAYKNADGVTEYSAEMQNGFEVNLSELDPDIKIIRFYCSY